MRWIVFKVISFIAVFIVTQGFLLPWIAATNLMPMWCAVLLISAIIVANLSLLDHLVIRLFSSNPKYKS